MFGRIQLWALTVGSKGLRWPVFGSVHVRIGCANAACEPMAAVSNNGDGQLRRSGAQFMMDHILGGRRLFGGAFVSWGSPCSKSHWFAH
jgi:hypothetical protein